MRHAPPAFRFPPAWLWLVEEAIPAWVKKEYSPRDSWKDKPFGKEDALFFFKGIAELSELFTDERPQSMPAYFAHPKFRSSYLLYFLPLQAAKFIALYEMYPLAMKAMMEHARAKGALRITDLGAGPGTASLALLLWLLGKPELGEIPPVELDWVDSNKTVLEDGRALAELLGSSFPKLRGKITVRTHISDWWKNPESLWTDRSIVLLGNVLNESSGPKNADEPPFARVLPRLTGAGAIFLEPAAKRPSQLLSDTRDHLIDLGAIEAKASSIWGPCMHAGRCPLSQGRDWCHFSLPADIPGKWFKQFSKSLGSERHWLKFSYLWIAAPSAPAPMPHKDQRRVISDPLGKPGPRTSHDVLICEPDEAGRIKPPIGKTYQRGDIYWNNQKIIK